MVEREWRTECGTIRYWIGQGEASKPALVFLPGLTADHRLFERQTACFEGRWPLMVWDPPGHGASWPFTLLFTLLDQAKWVEEILQAEGLVHPVIVGQSMGGYVGQAYAQLYPEKLRGFVAIDAAPLQRRCVTAPERWLLKRMEPLYRAIPWPWLLRSGAKGVAETAYGQQLMKEMMLVYQGNQDRYARLAGHGLRMLAEAVEADLPYRVACPALLLCGEKDRAGSCRRCSRMWHEQTGIPLHWIKGAGHNANADAPQKVNRLLEAFVQEIERTLPPG